MDSEKIRETTTAVSEEWRNKSRIVATTISDKTTDFKEQVAHDIYAVSKFLAFELFYWYFFLIIKVFFLVILPAVCVIAFAINLMHLGYGYVIAGVFLFSIMIANMIQICMSLVSNIEVVDSHDATIPPLPTWKISSRNFFFRKIELFVRRFQHLISNTIQMNRIQSPLGGEILTGFGLFFFLMAHQSDFAIFKNILFDFVVLVFNITVVGVIENTINMIRGLFDSVFSLSGSILGSDDLILQLGVSFFILFLGIIVASFVYNWAKVIYGYPLGHLASQKSKDDTDAPALPEPPSGSSDGNISSKDKPE